MATKKLQILGSLTQGSQSVYYIEGTGSTAGTWLGSHEGIKEYYPGLNVFYKIPVAGASTTKLNINDLGAVPVVKNVSTAVSTSYAVNSIVNLIYTLDGTTAYWKTADYDTNTKNSAGTSNKVDTKLFLVGGSSQNSSGVTTYSNTNVYIGTDNCLYSNGKKVATAEELEAIDELVGDTSVSAQIETATASMVKTVNGTAPDANGNVSVQAGVTSVNGKTGAVTINRESLLMIASATEPASPTTGMIWFDIS